MNIRYLFCYILCVDVRYLSSTIRLVRSVSTDRCRFQARKGLELYPIVVSCVIYFPIKIGQANWVSTTLSYFFDEEQTTVRNILFHLLLLTLYAGLLYFFFFTMSSFYKTVALRPQICNSKPSFKRR